MLHRKLYLTLLTQGYLVIAFEIDWSCICNPLVRPLNTDVEALKTLDEQRKALKLAFQSQDYSCIHIHYYEAQIA